MRQVAASVFLLASLIAVHSLPGCTRKNSEQSAIRIDGSSTVFPITEAVAEEFRKQAKNRVTIGVSGTGGGFKKFCSGSVAIAQASRPIKQSEMDLCKSKGIDFIELPIAYDGIAVVVNAQNNWASDLSVAELKNLWEPAAQGKITKWNQIRPQWPDKEIHLFAPGVDSGTYDYFTRVIVGQEHASRGDMTSSEDDNVLVQGVATDLYALGFLGFAYYAENKDQIKALPLGGVSPSFSTILDGSYQPLSRPIFIYVSKKEMSAENLKTFVEFYLREGVKLIQEVGYVPLSNQAYDLVRKRFTQGTTGSIFSQVQDGKVSTMEQILGGTANGFGS